MTIENTWVYNERNKIYSINVEDGEISLEAKGDETTLELYDSLKKRWVTAYFDARSSDRFICNLEDCHILLKYKYIERILGLSEKALFHLESIFLCMEDEIKGIQGLG